MSEEPQKPKRNRLPLVFIAIALALLLGCGACALILILSPSDGRTTTAERAAELDQPTEEATSEPAGTSISEPTAASTGGPTSALVPTNTVESTDTPEVQFDTTIYVTGSNMSVNDIPQGAPGLVVVLAGPASTFGVVPIVIRNNTDAPVFDIELSATARDEAGNVLGTGPGRDITPSYVPPGGLAIGRVLFGETPMEGATIEYRLTADNELDSSRRDLEVVNHSVTGGNVVGELLNRRDSALDSVKVVVVCVDSTGVPVAAHFDFTDQDRVESAAVLPFSVDLLGDEADCGRYLLAATGREAD